MWIEVKLHALEKFVELQRAWQKWYSQIMQVHFMISSYPVVAPNVNCSNTYNLPHFDGKPAIFISNDIMNFMQFFARVANCHCNVLRFILKMHNST